MTATVDENLADDALYPDDLPAPGDVSPGEDFDENAPYGWMRDKETGELRPKKSPGRPKKPPGPEEIATREPITPGPDEPPRPRPPGKPRPDSGEVPMPKGGVLATGVNHLYRRAGKFLRILDNDLGLAVIDCTRPDPEDPDGLTVGQAWENLAKINPRVRAWLVNLLKGGTWQDLVLAHAPIGLALMTKEWVQKLIPFHRATEVLLEEDEDTKPTDLRPADAQEMHDMAQAQAQKIARRMGVRVPSNVAAAAMRQAEHMAAAGGKLTPPYEGHDLPESEADGPPAGLHRHQPQRRSRAARRK